MLDEAARKTASESVSQPVSELERVFQVLNRVVGTVKAKVFAKEGGDGADGGAPTVQQQRTPQQ